MKGFSYLNAGPRTSPSGRTKDVLLVKLYDDKSKAKLTRPIPLLLRRKAQSPPTVRPTDILRGRQTVRHSVGPTDIPQEASNGERFTCPTLLFFLTVSF